MERALQNGIKEIMLSGWMTEKRLPDWKLEMVL